MVDHEISYRGVIRGNNIPFILSKKLYELNRECINIEERLLLDDVGCDTVSDYFLKVEKVVGDVRYSKNLYREQSQSLYKSDSYPEIKNMKNEIVREYKDIISSFQKILSLDILSSNIYDKIIYLPCFMDNRGRIYYGTLLSPTFYKVCRHLYIFAKDKEFENLYASKFYNKIIVYKKFLKEYERDKLRSYILIVLFIEVGKYYTSGGKYNVLTESLIESGVERYKKRDLKLEFEDVMYLNKIYHNIDMVLNNVIDNNVIIFKDATASGLQNYGVLMGYKEDKLEYLNINNDN